MHLNISNYSGSEKMLIEDQRTASSRSLAFWSNPAWFPTSKHSSLTDSAIMEWVAYNRLLVAINKGTVVQIIRSVKEVIPNSRLAKYGDYHYDIDTEDMYCIAEDSNLRSRILKADKFTYARRYDFWGSEAETDISDTSDFDMYPANNRDYAADFNSTVRSLSEWLKELQQVLMKVRQIANEAQLLDSWTETLLKFCLRFICILRNNENLVELLNSEIPFIIDYERLSKMPSSKIELQSIPRPENNGNYISLDKESVDDLWLKFSSPSIQNIWRKEMNVSFPFDNESQRNKNLVPMIKINFHRSLQSKIVCCPRRTTDISLEIPKNIETELLGSLLSIINEDSGDAFTKANDTAKNYFPEAHGEWTKHLFPHCADFNPRFEKNSGIWKPWNAAPSLKESDTNVKLQCRCSETAELPAKFYKYVPPPTLTARFRSPYVNYQSRNRVAFMTPKNLTSNPSNQQMHLKVWTGPGSNVQPAICFSQTSFPKHCNIRQRLSTPTATGQYHKLNILQEHQQYYNSESTKEPQRYSSNVCENSCPKTIPVENEVKYLNYTKHGCDNMKTIALSDTPLPTTEPFVQLSHGYNTPIRIQQNTGNTSKTTPSTILNSELQVRESRMPLKMTYPMTSIRLRKPIIKMVPSPRNHYILPQFTTKPRFLGSITVNCLKRMQERLFQQRHQYEYKNNPSYQNLEKSASFENMSSSNLNDICPAYEDKVEKWLESANKYFKNGSYINLEDLPKFPSGELLELTTIESPKLPNAKLPELTTIELPNVKLPELDSVKLHERTSVESAELSTVELPELYGIKLPKHSKIRFLDIYDKSYDGGKGDSEESGKSQNESTVEAPEQNLPGDYIKSTLNIRNTTVIPITRESKANILKRKKLKAKREFFEHLQLFPDIVPRLKSCKNSRKKIKIVRKYFAEINSLSSKKFPLNFFTEILRKKNEFIKKVGQRNTKFSTLRQERCLGMKLDKQLSTECDFNMDQSNFLINDISKYKIWIRESQEFNAFPSKRVKIGKSQPSFMKTKTLVRDEQDRWISSLKYFDSIIDELFFAENGIEGILFIRNQYRMINEGTKGWDHFKVDVKTVMKNIIFSLNEQVS